LTLTPGPPFSLSLCTDHLRETAQAAAGLLAAQGHSVHFLLSLSYAARGAELADALAVAGGAIHVTSTSGASARGLVAGVNADAAAVVPGADAIIISLPGPAVAPMLAELAPHLAAHQLVLLLRGMGPANYMAFSKAAEAAQGPGTPLPFFAATKALPWDCCALSPGCVVVSGGPMARAVPVAAAPGAPAAARAALPQLLGGLFPGTVFELHDTPLDTILGIAYGLELNALVVSAIDA
jgi:hypothetical protein